MAEICSVLVLVDVVVEQLGDEVDVCQDHAAAAVPVEAQFVECQALNGLLLTVVALHVLVGRGACRVDDSLLVCLNLLD